LNAVRVEFKHMLLSQEVYYKLWLHVRMSFYE